MLTRRIEQTLSLRYKPGECFCYDELDIMMRVVVYAFRNIDSKSFRDIYQWDYNVFTALFCLSGIGRIKSK